MKRNTITIHTTTPAYGGTAIGRLDGKVVMVKGAIPGETVEASVDEDRKDYATATATRILEPSPERVSAPCGYYGVCGGCQFQHISYAGQVRIKEAVLSDCLRRMAKLNVELSPPLTGEPFGYRLRGQFKLSPGKAGFYREKSRDVVDILSCPIMAPEVNGRFSEARRILAVADARETHITCGDGATALIRPGRESSDDWASVAGRFMDAGFAAVAVETDRDAPTAYGRGYTLLDLDGIAYRISPMSFFQSNWRLNLELVRLVTGGLGPVSGMKIIDLYSGAGNFSLPLARAGAEVTAVEENPHAVRDGNESADANGIKGCAFVRAAVDGYGIPAGTDALVIDPPRPGITNIAMDRILAASPERIVYVSCNPSTFARDLRKLGAHYTVESVRLVDFFPQTSHIEAVAFLVRA